MISRIRRKSRDVKRLGSEPRELREILPDDDQERYEDLSKVRLPIRFIIGLAALLISIICQFYIGWHKQHRYLQSLDYKPPSSYVCEGRIEMLGNELLHYAKSNEGMLPSDDGTGFGYISSLHPEDPPGLISDEYRCPEDKSESVTSYKINSAICKKSLLDITDRQKTKIVLLREVGPKSHKMVFYLDGHITGIDEKGKIVNYNESSPYR